MVRNANWNASALPRRSPPAPRTVNTPPLYVVDPGWPTDPTSWLCHGLGSPLPPPPPPVPPPPPPAAPDVTFAERRFMPPLSKSTVISCVPAPSVTGTFTVCQFCQPPVAGIDTVCQTLLAALKPRCNDAPPGDATRSWTV